MQQLSMFDTEIPRPLAARLRPETLDDYVGQTHLIGPGKVLRRLIENDQVSSMIFWGPPGVGKTTLANIIANNLKAVYPLPDKVRAVPTDSLGEVLRTKAVAVLCELGYHDNFADEAWLKNNLENIAKNLVRSLCDYFGIPFVNAGAVRWGTVTTDGSNLNIRNYPSLSGTVIGKIPDGARVTINGALDSWYVVSYNGINGYSSSEFITL